MKTNKCRFCGKEWIPRVSDPVQCPRCKREDWKEIKGKEEVEELTK